MRPFFYLVKRFITFSLGLTIAAFLWTNAPRASNNRPVPPVVFQAVPPEKSGVRWVHDNMKSAEHWLPETMGPGVAIFDYNNDGCMDLFFANSGPADFASSEKMPKNGLYQGHCDGTFTDVSEKAGIANNDMFGQGVAVADYDNDGYQDIYITGYGHNLLYHNNGDGTFRNVTQAAGVSAAGWSTSAAFFDADNDGFLDLFVGSFVEYSPKSGIVCEDNAAGRKYYCIPRVFKGRPSLLFHNNGNGTFTEVGHLSDIGKALAKTNGVVVTDVNNDRMLDLLVANDTVGNNLFLNLGQNKFRDIGVESGVAYGENGIARSGMGVDTADFDNNGRLDLYVANINQEMFSLYRNRGDETYSDIARETGIGPATVHLSGWGVRFVDYDNDGRMDIIQADGHPDDMVSLFWAQVTYEKLLLLFRQTPQGFHNVSSESGAVFSSKFSARGLAVGDLDNDGDLDIVVGVNGGPPLLLRNDGGNRNSWVGISLVGKKCNRDAIGTRISWSADGVVRHTAKMAGGSYLSSSDPRLILGLGNANRVDWVEVAWPLPSNRVERFEGLSIRSYHALVEGTGAAVTSSFPH